MLHSGSLIARHGGLLVDVETSNEENAIVKMMRLLRNKDIDGFLLDRYTYLTVYYHMRYVQILRTSAVAQLSPRKKLAQHIEQNQTSIDPSNF